MGRTTWDGGRRWRHWTEEQARGVLEELAASGESAASFARRKGISTRRVAYWKKRLGVCPTAEFVAVELPPTTTAARIEIVAGGMVVRVREEMDVDHVARLVEAIGQRMGGAC